MFGVFVKMIICGILIWQYDRRNKFLDSLSPDMFLSYIFHPTRVTSHSQAIHKPYWQYLS